MRYGPFNKQVRTMTDSKLHELMDFYQQIIIKNDYDYIQNEYNKNYSRYEQIDKSIRSKYETCLEELKKGKNELKRVYASDPIMFQLHLIADKSFVSEFSKKMEQAEEKVNNLQYKIEELEESYPNLKIIKKLAEYSSYGLNGWENFCKYRVYVIKGELDYRKKHHFSL